MAKLRVYHLRRFMIVLALSLCASVHAVDRAPAQDPPAESAPQEHVNLGEEFHRSNASGGIFDLALTRKLDRPRAFFGMQLLSFILPGFGQWIEGQWYPAAFYTGLGVAGLVTLQAAARPEGNDVDLDSRDNRDRTFFLGAQVYQAAGGLSAYASFRSAVRTQQPAGRFKFLTEEDDVGDVLAAPFEFSQLLKPSTLIPLAVVGTLVAVGTDIHFKGNNYGWADAAFGSAYSFNAGTHEEAVFRGWLMPIGQEYIGNRWVSNGLTALLFAAAHISGDNKVPWVQFLFGFYEGFLTQRNGWSIRQSVFVHVWWDAIAFAAGYLDDGSKKVAINLPLSFVF